MKAYGAALRFCCKNSEQYRDIGRFWDLMRNLYPAADLVGIGYDWREDSLMYLIGTLDEQPAFDLEAIQKEFPAAGLADLKLPDDEWLEYRDLTDRLNALYDDIYKGGPLDYEIERFDPDGRCTVRIFRNKKAASAIRYRLASPADAPPLARLRWLHEWEQDPRQPMTQEDFLPLCEKFLASALEEKSCFCFLAEEAGEIISNIWVCRVRKIPSPREPAGQIGYVTNVHTLRQYRGRGVGGALMERAKAHARENGYELLFVWPSERAVPFYERQGFRAENDIMECPLCGE